jgi:hypothetical protein
MEAADIIKRVGKGLLVFGAICTARSTYNMVEMMENAHASWLPWPMWAFCIDFPDLLLGVFLLRGSRRAAGITTWFAISVVTASLLSPILQLTQPAELLYTKMSLYFTQVMKDSALWVLQNAVYVLVLRELMSDPVLQARAEAKGKRLIPLSVPAVLTILGGVATVAFLLLNFTNEVKGQTQALVEKQIGAGYKYYMQPLRITWSQLGKFYDVEVTAYKDDAILVGSFHVPDPANRPAGQKERPL